VSVSLSVYVCTLKEKQLELLTPNFVLIYSMAVARYALTWSKGQGHMVMKMSRPQKSVLLWLYAAAARVKQYTA